MKSTPGSAPGCGNSLPKDASPQATSTSAQLLMFSLPTSPALPSATSSPAYPAGRSRSPLPASPQISLFGPGHAHVLRSPAPAKRKAALNAVASAYFRILSEPEYLPAVSAGTNGPLTRGTFGRTFLGSSASAALQSSLENRLVERMERFGSPEYELVWKSRPMALGRPILQRQASRHPTSDNGSGGWPTPQVCQGPNAGRNRGKDWGGERRRLTAQSVEGIMIGAGWSTPKANGRTGECKHGEGGADLQTMAGWATPKDRDYRSESATQENLEKQWTHPRGKDLNKQATHLVGWSTPQVADSRGRTGPASKNRDLSRDALQSAGWPTPNATRNGQGESPDAKEKRGMNPGLNPADAAALASGTTPSGTPASTANSDGSRLLLNPFFSGWLMGFPTEWTLCGLRALASLSPRPSKAAPPSSKPTATQSIPSSPQSSSSPLSMPSKTPNT